MMSLDSAPELESLPEAEQVRVRRAVLPGSFKDPRVLSAYIVQVIGFVLLFFVFFPTAQPRLLLLLAYAIPTMIIVKFIHSHVIHELVVAYLANEPQGQAISPDSAP
ncbi:MAG: hypothetical protein ACAH07_04780 [Methylophilaceae bacterium]|nr:hypothetical protein [Methyloradius sp.]